MNFRRMFEEFNPCRFFVFTLLFFFVLLFSLRSDKFIQCSYWLVFTPLWLWKLTMLVGFLQGCIVWCRRPMYRVDNHVHFKAMCTSAIAQSILLVFELLICNRLESGAPNWMYCFIPLLVLGITGIGLCVWSLKNSRSCELELVCSTNILLFVFTPLRLEQWIDWSWSVIFVPLWIVMSVCVVLVMYGLILSIILCKSPEFLPDQRNHTLSITLGYACVVFPLLLFEVLLAQRLDKQITSNYTTVALPLLFVLAVMVVMAFKIRGGNPWWFGIRRSFCQFILETCPLLQEYGNISYKFHNLASLSFGRRQQATTTTEETTDSGRVIIYSADRAPPTGTGSKSQPKGSSPLLSTPVHLLSINVPD